MCSLAPFKDQLNEYIYFSNNGPEGVFSICAHSHLLLYLIITIIQGVPEQMINPQTGDYLHN